MRRSLRGQKGTVVLSGGGNSEREYANNGAVVLGSSAMLVELLALLVPAPNQSVTIDRKLAYFFFQPAREPLDYTCRYLKHISGSFYREKIKLLAGVHERAQVGCLHEFLVQLLERKVSSFKVRNLTLEHTKGGGRSSAIYGLFSEPSQTCSRLLCAY